MQLKLVLIVILLWFVESRAQPRLQHKNIKTFKGYQNHLIKRFIDSQEFNEVKESAKRAPEVTRKSLVDFILKDHEKLTVNLLDTASGLKFSLLQAKSKIYEIPSECVMGAMNSIINKAKGKESEHLIDGGKTHSMLPLSTELDSKSNPEQCWFMVLDSGLASSKFDQENNHLKTSDNILCCRVKPENNAWPDPTNKPNQPMLSKGEIKPIAKPPRLTKNSNNQGNNNATGNITSATAAVVALETVAGAIEEVDLGAT